MTLLDIQTKIYNLTKTDSSSYTNANMLIEINSASSRVFSLALQADGRWQLDDNNQSDLPSATSTITSSQQDYSLAVAHLKITGVDVKPNGGGASSWYKLDTYDPEDFDGIAPSALAAQTGAPLMYDKKGSSIFFYPVPNYTQAASIRIYFQRGPYVFSSGELSTGTAVPGFNSLYHDLIPLWVAYRYWIVNKPEKANFFMAEIQRLERQLTLDYGKRDKDDRPIMTGKPIQFI